MKYLYKFKNFNNLIFESSFSKIELPTNEQTEICNKISIDNFNSAIKSFLGSGVFGWAFELENGLVMKLTTDESEALNAKRLISTKNTNLITYYDVIRLESDSDIKYGTGSKYKGTDFMGRQRVKYKRTLLGMNNTYCILMDKVDQKISNSQKKNYLDFWGNHNTHEGYSDSFKNKILNMSDEDIKKYCLGESNRKISESVLNTRFDIVKIYQELFKNNIITTDVHWENMGIKNGKIIAFDFGFTDDRYKSNLLNFDSSYRKEYSEITNYRLN